MSRKAWLAILVAVFVPVVSYLIVKNASEKAISVPRKYFSDSIKTQIKDGKQFSDTVWHSVRNIKLINQLGDTVFLDQLKGKVIVADFFFTRCPSICPTLTANMKRLQDALSSKDQFKQSAPAFVQFLSFSVDPERDSAAVLKKYGNKYQINPDSWWLLTGPKKEIYDFALDELKMGLVDGEGVDSNFIHTQKMVVLDKDHVVRGYYNGLDSADLSRLANDIVFIMLEKDKNYISPLIEMKAILPIIVFILVATGFVVYFLSRKSR
jgi:protein SCO1